MDFIEKVKSIQKEYLTLLDFHFGTLKKEFDSSNTDLYSFLSNKRNGSKIIIPTSNHSSLSSFDYTFYIFYKEVEEFWKLHYDALQLCLKNIDSLNICIWGDDDIESSISKYGIYFDSILIPDAVPNYSFEYKKKQKVPFLWKIKVIEQVFFFLELRTLVYANVDVPIIVFFPQLLGYFNTNYISNFKTEEQKLTKENYFLSKKLIDEIIGIEINTNSVHELIASISLLNYNKINKNIQYDLLDKYISPLRNNIESIPLSRETEGINPLFENIENRKINKNDLVVLLFLFMSFFSLLDYRDYNANYFSADNSVTDIFWDYQNFKFNIFSNEHRKHFEINDETILSYSFKKEFKWLSNVKLDDLLKIRESGFFNDLREVFRLSRNRVKKASILDYEKLSIELEENVIASIEDYSYKIEKDKIEFRKKTGLSIANFSATLILGVSSLAFPELLPLTIISFLQSISVGASIKDIISSHFSGKNRIEKLGNRPLSFLLNVYNRK